VAGDATQDVTTLREGRFLRLARRATWEVCQRTTGTGVVGMIATTDAGEIVLVEQDRPPLGRRCVELPAGIVGDEGDETVEAAARRELLEETGFAADRVERACHGVVSAGLTDEAVTLVRMTGLARVGAGGGVGNEAIATHVVPVGVASSFLSDRVAAGRAVDLKVWSALWLLASERAPAR